MASQVDDAPEGEEKDVLNQRRLDMYAQYQSAQTALSATRRQLRFLRNEVRAHERKLPTEVFAEDSNELSFRNIERRMNRRSSRLNPDETRNAVYA